MISEKEFQERREAVRRFVWKLTDDHYTMAFSGSRAALLALGEALEAKKDQEPYRSILQDWPQLYVDWKEGLKDLAGADPEAQDLLLPVGLQTTIPMDFFQEDLTDITDSLQALTRETRGVCVSLCLSEGEDRLEGSDLDLYYVAPGLPDDAHGGWYFFGTDLQTVEEGAPEGEASGTDPQTEEEALEWKEFFPNEAGETEDTWLMLFQGKRQDMLALMDAVERRKDREDFRVFWQAWQGPAGDLRKDEAELEAKSLPASAYLGLYVGTPDSPLRQELPLQTSWKKPEYLMELHQLVPQVLISSRVRGSCFLWDRCACCTFLPGVEKPVLMLWRKASSGALSFEDELWYNYMNRENVSGSKAAKPECRRKYELPAQRARRLEENRVTAEEADRPVEEA